MTTETITLIIAITGLIIAVATLIVAIMTYKYYMDSDKRNVRRRIRRKEERYNSLDNFIKSSPFSFWNRMVTEKHFEERDKLKEEIKDLKDKL